VTVLLVDAGPIVALLNERERAHAWAVNLFKSLAPPLVTCEPVITESCYLLGRFGGQQAVLSLLARGILVCEFRLLSELDAVRALMKKFSDVPMSLADACLVRMSELNRDPVVVTLDRDFQIYRRNGRQAIRTMMPT
jgi:uncharacterized protein